MDAAYSILGGLLVGLFLGLVLISIMINYKAERLEGKVNAILKHLGIAFPPAPSERIKGIARDPARKGARIEAIKAYREETGLGLKEAKDAVDNWLATKSG
jgi:ribosomal protein L7/L12